ncbi:MAG: response regulator [Thermosynechococcaceae cyanobacterium]
MTAPEPSSFASQPHIDAAEAQLQQELRAMFALDTQQHLQTYFEVVQRLNAQSWTTDIQNIYRAIHTIKGGAVTVEAEALLRAASVLEDLLSDLRYLDQAPSLDGQLNQMLLEAGELLSSAIDVKGTGEDAIASIQPTLDRLSTLHEQIKQRYIPDWNELTQVHQEFAEQGFDLVILDLEMAINQLSAGENVPAETLQQAQQTLSQLTQIGVDLQFAEDWTALIVRGQDLAEINESDLWCQAWPLYFQALKDCAKHSGHYDLEQLPALSEVAKHIPSPKPAPQGMPDSSERADVSEPATAELSVDLTDALASELDLSDLDDAFFDEDEAGFEDELLSAELTDALETDLDLSELEDSPNDRIEVLPQAVLDSEDLVSALSNLEDGTEEATAIHDLPDIILNLDDEEDLALEITALEAIETPGEAAIHDLIDTNLKDLATALDRDINLETPAGLFPTTSGSQGLFPVAASEQPAIAEPDLIPTPNAEADLRGRIKIPVPLERLDQSAQQVVETLLTARSTLTTSKSLAFQMSQLVTLTQESAQYITRLRQLQDDYALLRSLSHEQDPANGTSLEQYRQGYTTINQLLENILRMSELSREIDGMTQKTVAGMGQLDRNLLRLKDGIESTRLLPFKNLSLRAKAIIRDLTNRYDKPAKLVVRGEQLELDAGVIQQLEPALLHLLRNAYDHGLESVEERMSQGKSVQGTIGLSLQRRGNIYRLTLQDDGRGIDAAAIQQKAQEKGFPLTHTQSTGDLLAVLCQPGFSSRSVAGDVSGRGVGMDVVAGQIKAMGGRLNLESRLGQGSTFTIEVPAPQLLVPCVLLQVGKRTVAIPAEEIRETVLASSIQVMANDNALCQWTVATARGEAPGFNLSTYWQQPQAELSETAVCLRIRQDADRDADEMWLIADDLLGQEAMLINPIPSPLTVPAGLLGVSLQSDGSLTSVIDPIALIEAIQSQPHATRPTATPQVEDAATAPTILIVDDAALMRRRLESSLQTYGFVTHTCSDGLEALHWLQSNRPPALLVTDIEMPNMDGFTLLDRCRTDGMEMPILVISSRLSEEWGREAKRLGANAYLNKGFSTSDLIEQVTGLIKSRALQALL